MRHIALAGDSIFDNRSYVLGEPCLTDQLRTELGNTAKVSLLAVDGSFSSDVLRQMGALPEGASHLVISAGGNDALASKSWLRGIRPSELDEAEESHQPESGPLFRRGPDPKRMLSVIRQADDVLQVVAVIQDEFRLAYRRLLDAAVRLRLPCMVCTIYDSIPDLEPKYRTTLSVFNDVIFGEAIAQGLPVLDLRFVCREAEDYSALSPIEPSARGGLKIAAAICKALEAHDFSSRRTTVYS
jgi:hypothetical protein